MTERELDEIMRRWVDKYARTHWDECWKVHPACAIAKVIVECRRLRKELSQSKRKCAGRESNSAQ